MTQEAAIADSSSHPPIDGGLRNAWQWLAMVTMVADHVGLLYGQYEYLRYIGRLAMPLYAMLFVMTIRSGHVHHRRLLALAIISQIPYLLLFNDLRPNIIFDFAIFYSLTVAIQQRGNWQGWIGIPVTIAAMCLPCSYGWYLYASLAAFYWLGRQRAAQRGVFAFATVIYTVLTGIHPRQLLAIGAPFIQGIRAIRPNKYLYRYFYPGHLLILLVINIIMTGAVVTPFGTYPKPEPFDDPQEYQEYDEVYESYGTYETDAGIQRPDETGDYGKY